MNFLLQSKKVNSIIHIGKIIDIFLFPFTFLVGIYLKIFTKSPPYFLPNSYKWFTKCGWLPVRFHYYQPIINKKMLPINYESLEIPLTGIDLNFESQLNLLNEFKYNSELENIPLEKKNETEPYYHNINFPSGDAELLYNMIRHFKPKRVIEIGSGNSTKFVRTAILKNKFETGNETEHVCIEPYEQPWLENLGICVLRTPVEKIDLSFFKNLGENDILFIDSSHIIRTQGDVVFEYLKIIPSLNKGVIIHCHDIYTPREYPLEWIEKRKRFWNEQYLLQALLAHSPRYEILLAGFYLTTHYRSNLEKCCPILKKEKTGSSSFWFKVVK